MAAQHAENGRGARPLRLHIVDARIPDRIQQVDDEKLVRRPGQDETGRLDGARQDSPGHEALDEILENRQRRASDGGELFHRVGGQARLVPSSDLDEGYEPDLVPEADAVPLARGDPAADAPTAKCTYLIYDPRPRQLPIANAGHL